MTAEAADEETPEFGGQPPKYPDPQDRSEARLSELGDIEYIDDVGRPGRLVVIAAEEGTGKSYLCMEGAMRLALEKGALAGVWDIKQQCNVLYLSEMHTDDDFKREEEVLTALDADRKDLAGTYYRLNLYEAANWKPPLGDEEWVEFIIGWMKTKEITVVIFDTVTTAIAKPSWGEDLTNLITNLRKMQTTIPGLLIILAVHMTKPTSRAERSLSSVMGEYGRFNDVTVLMENDGRSLTRVKVTVRKRVRQERRLILTKRGGIFVDPVDVGKGGPKVAVETQAETITEKPGLTILELSKIWEVTKPTAQKYVDAMGEAVRQEPTGEGKQQVIKVYPATHAGVAR